MGLITAKLRVGGSEFDIFVELTTGGKAALIVPAAAERMLKLGEEKEISVLIPEPDEKSNRAHTAVVRIVKKNELHDGDGQQVVVVTFDPNNIKHSWEPVQEGEA